ncbi:MAG: hypothetical protein H8D67_14770 [Deltaproteobacteria bacterium]|nr:hypothetical protein [Deltaproteobacteria bacterium]
MKIAIIILNSIAIIRFAIMFANRELKRALRLMDSTRISRSSRDSASLPTSHDKAIS